MVDLKTLMNNVLLNCDREDLNGHSMRLVAELPLGLSERQAIMAEAAAFKGDRVGRINYLQSFVVDAPAKEGETKWKK